LGPVLLAALRRLASIFACVVMVQLLDAMQYGVAGSAGPAGRAGSPSKEMIRTRGEKVAEILENPKLFRGSREPRSRASHG
jgi:hypothetical protein